MVELATKYGRYGYRRVTAMLREQGWQVNHKRIERLWRREGLKVPQNSLNAESCGSMRLLRKAQAQGPCLELRFYGCSDA